MDILKAMPSSKEAEQAVLGCILESGNMDELVGLLDKNDFYVSSHKAIFSCLTSMYKKDKNIDIITVIESLKSKDMLDLAGGASYLVALKGGIINTRNLIHYAEIVKDKSSKRKFILSAQEMLKEAYEDKLEVKDIISKAEESMFNIASNKSKDFVNIGECIEAALKNIEKNYLKGGGIVGISTGYKNLDRCTSGLQRSDFIVIAARPSMGKTAFAINLANNIAHDAKVAIFSLEMSEEQLSYRLQASEALLEFSRVNKGAMNDDEWVELTKASARLAGKNIKINDSGELDVSEIKAKCKRLKLKQGLDVVIIDYLQCIKLNEKVYLREQEVSKISAALKNMAKELDITVVALSQLSRAPEKRADHRPQLGDLRDSGSIEQDADIIMLLYRDEYYHPDTEDKNITEVIIGKNRNGQVGTTKLAWLAQYQKFAELKGVDKRGDSRKSSNNGKWVN
jgi:replicative DNA helicase